MFIQAYLDASAHILSLYKGEEPFHIFIKKYFTINKKFGSRDRKQITQFCYNYFRLGKSFHSLPIEERLLVGTFLCHQAFNPILHKKAPQWNESIELNVDDKILLLQKTYSFHLQDIFPFAEHLSPNVEEQTFLKAFLFQPHTFLRIRPGKEEMVKQKLSEYNIPFTYSEHGCLELAPSVKIDEIIKLDAEAVVQDKSSQKVLHPLLKVIKDHSLKLSAWDCCAASGGKSILLWDHFHHVQLTVSDIRKSILINLQNRFIRAGIYKYHWFVADISDPEFEQKKQYDLILCDAPCTGSGTWSRTPEQLYFFKEEKINQYNSLQKSIAAKAVKSLKKEGYFLYITCSVFKEENEEVVQYLQDNCNLQLQNMEYIIGYENSADTLFSALLIKK